MLALSGIQIIDDQLYIFFIALSMGITLKHTFRNRDITNSVHVTFPTCNMC